MDPTIRKTARVEREKRLMAHLLKHPQVFSRVLREITVPFFTTMRFQYLYRKLQEFVGKFDVVPDANQFWTYLEDNADELWLKVRDYVERYLEKVKHFEARRDDLEYLRAEIREMLTQNMQRRLESDMGDPEAYWQTVEDYRTCINKVYRANGRKHGGIMGQFDLSQMSDVNYTLPTGIEYADEAFRGGGLPAAHGYCLVFARKGVGKSAWVFFLLADAWHKRDFDICLLTTESSESENSRKIASSITGYPLERWNWKKRTFGQYVKADLADLPLLYNYHLMAASLGEVEEHLQEFERQRRRNQAVIVIDVADQIAVSNTKLNSVEAAKERYEYYATLGSRHDALVFCVTHTNKIGAKRELPEPVDVDGAYEKIKNAHTVFSIGVAKSTETAKERLLQFKLHHNRYGYEDRKFVLSYDGSCCQFRFVKAGMLYEEDDDETDSRFTSKVARVKEERGRGL